MVRRGGKHLMEMKTSVGRMKTQFGGMEKHIGGMEKQLVEVEKYFGESEGEYGGVGLWLGETRAVQHLLKAYPGRHCLFQTWKIISDGWEGSLEIY